MKRKLAEFVFWVVLAIAFGCVSSGAAENERTRPIHRSTWTRIDHCRVFIVAPEWAGLVHIGGLTRPVSPTRIVVVYQTCDCVPGPDFVVFEGEGRSESWVVERVGCDK